MNEEILELGFLDTNIYIRIALKIATEKVIITEKQLGHIAKCRPEAYDEVLIELKATLANPDYIFKDDKHDDTGLVVKEIKTGQEHLHIVLKVCTDSDGGRLANSVISVWKIIILLLYTYNKVHKSI